MYATADNFTGQLLYDDLKEAYLHPDALTSLIRAQRLLKEKHPEYCQTVIMQSASTAGIGYINAF